MKPFIEQSFYFNKFRRLYIIQAHNTKMTNKMHFNVYDVF
jgi:hypothetical protein